MRLDGLANVTIEPLDLLNPASIDAFAAKFVESGKPLHILINNAGIMANPLTRDARGYESQFATNHLGHFHLATRLWPALKRANGARVVAVSSRGHRRAGVDFDDPNFERRNYEEQGAATSLWCTTSPTLDGMGGVYCEDCNIAQSVPADSAGVTGVRPWAIDRALAQRLWALSERLTGVRATLD
jgi:NAD(P)-dependent dehydrogenase (short-subunit alcohol dehydrogenase family)